MPVVELTVVGSVNLDLVARAERLPRPGETVSDAAFARHPGGKGANQAVAAARHGAAVTFVGSVGEDAFADEALAGLREAGVTTVLQRGATTGVALIVVDDEGENTIVVAPGANGELRGPGGYRSGALPARNPGRGGRLCSRASRAVLPQCRSRSPHPGRARPRRRTRGRQRLRAGGAAGDAGADRADARGRGGGAARGRQGGGTRPGAAGARGRRHRGRRCVHGVPRRLAARRARP